MSNPASISGVDLTTPQGRQILQDALDTLYGLIQKAGGTAAGPTTFDELRVRMLTVLGTINVVPEDKPPANVNSRLVSPWLTGQRGRGEVWRFEDQHDGGDLLEVRSQPYLIGSPTATAGDWEFRFYSAQRDPAGAYRSLGAIRFGSDGRIRTYDASEVVNFDSTLVLTTAPLPPRYVSGLVICTASAATFTVSAGKCRNKADTADLALAAAVTVTRTTAGAALGYERRQLTGTHTLNWGTGQVTGTGSAYLTDFGTRPVTGTISNTGVSVTGTGTRFLSEVAVNDMIGVDATTGYMRVVSIESDTALTLNTYPSAQGKTDFSGSTVTLIEQPVIESAGGVAHGLGFILSNTSLYANHATASATETGVAAYASAKSTLDNTSYTCLWRSVWLVSGGSGTTVVLSTQRTTPYVAGAGTVTPSGYGTSYRRIGWVRVAGASYEFLPQRGSDTTAARWTYYNDDNGSTYIRIVNNASATTPAVEVTAQAQAPPTSRRIYLLAQQYSPNTANPVYYGPRGAGSQILYVWTTSTSGFASLVNPVDTDGAQYLTYTDGGAGATGDGTYFDVYGYEDTLE